MVQKYKFWQQAIDEWIDMWARNQQIAEEIQKTWKWLTTETFNQVTWLWQWQTAKDYWMQDKDFLNTFEDIKNRYNQLKPIWEMWTDTTWTNMQIDTQTNLKTEIPQTEQGLQQDILWQAEQRIREEEKGIQIEQERLAIKQQWDYMQKSKEQEEYLRSQREQWLKQQDIWEKITQISESQAIRNADKQLQNLKSNISYLWNMWRPAVSAVKLDAVWKQITEAETVVSELKQIDALRKEARELWKTQDAEQFERQMTLLQDDLDSKVNTVIQEALSNISAFEIEGKLDTVEDIDKIRMQVLDSIDRSVEGITNRNIQLRQDLITQYKDIANSQKEYISNKNKFTVHPSWYYVDWNWEAVIWTNWQQITVPKEPVFSWIQDWKFVSIYEDENWQLVTNMVDVIDKPTFEQQTISDFAKLVAEWKLWIKDIPESVKNTDLFIKTLASIQPDWTDLIWKDRYISVWWEVFDTISWNYVWKWWQLWQQPTWNIETAFVPTSAKWWWINVTMDSVALPWLQWALEEMNQLWLDVNINQSNWTFRTYDVQQWLKDTVQWRVADPNLSLHTKWLAVDLYWWVDAQGRLTRPTQEQVEIMAKYWFVQPYPEDDAGHFEYSGTEQQQVVDQDILIWINDLSDIILPEKITDTKLKFFWYGTRMDQANENIKKLEKEFLKKDLLQQYWTWLLPNFVKWVNQQKLEQAERNFINAVLRQESWAAIGKDEFESAKKQYFAQPWDSIETLNQKKENRDLSIQNMFKWAWVDNKWRNISEIWLSLRKKQPEQPQQPQATQQTNNNIINIQWEDVDLSDYIDWWTVWNNDSIKSFEDVKNQWENFFSN